MNVVFWLVGVALMTFKRQRHMYILPDAMCVVDLGAYAGIVVSKQPQLLQAKDQQSELPQAQHN
jgi:hypothetical protein